MTLYAQQPTSVPITAGTFVADAELGRVTLYPALPTAIFTLNIQLLRRR